MHGTTLMPIFLQTDKKKASFPNFLFAKNSQGKNRFRSDFQTRKEEKEEGREGPSFSFPLSYFPFLRDKGFLRKRQATVVSRGLENRHKGNHSPFHSF